MEKPLWILLVDKWDYILFFRDKILKQLNISNPHDIILEIGCGRRGWLSLILKSYSDTTIITSDVVREKVVMAKKIAQSLGHESNSYIVSDCQRLPFINGVFDKVIGNAVLHHVLDCIATVGEEIKRTLKQNGEGLFTGEIVASRSICWFVKKFVLSKGKNKVDNEGIATSKDWKKKFKGAGFNQIAITKENRAKYNIGFQKRIYYSAICRLPNKVCTDYLLTSCTITLKN